MTDQNSPAPTIGAKPPSKRLYTEEEVAALLSGMQKGMRKATQTMSRIAANLEAWVERDKAEMAAEQRARLQAEKRNGRG